jgi:AraC family transcriptional regulator, regulatory protein of adaptative response / methylated-DNA-[protein]-cysteine methyltransferase
MNISEKVKPHFILIEATDREIRDGEMEIRWGVSHAAFGNMVLAKSPRGITHLSFSDGDADGTPEDLRSDWPNAQLIRDDSLTVDTHRLHVKGTPFQIRVWRALLEIPIGSLSTYGKIAAALGMPGASRAVGSAVGANRISLLIPCHRVIRADGGLGGYRWGTERKRAMLAAEGVGAVFGEKTTDS